MKARGTDTDNKRADEDRIVRRACITYGQIQDSEETRGTRRELRRNKVRVKERERR